MKRFVAALVCVNTIEAHEVVFGETDYKLNNYFVFESSGTYDIARVTLQNRAFMNEEVTLRVKGNTLKHQTSVAPKAFSEIKANGLKIHLKFEKGEKDYVKMPDDCSDMFRNSVSIVSIDFDGISSSPDIQNMAGMFRGCSTLEQVELGRLNTSEVT